MTTPRPTRLLLATAALYAAALAVAACTWKTSGSVTIGADGSEIPGPSMTHVESYGAGMVAALAVLLAAPLALLGATWRTAARPAQLAAIGVAGVACATTFLMMASFGLFLLPWTLALLGASIVLVDEPRATAPAFDPRAPERA